MSRSDYLTVAVVLGVLAILFGLLRLYQVKAAPPPERVRKLFHVLAGLFGLPLPWIFNRFAPVLLLGVIALIAFVAMRFSIRLRRGVGQVLFGVQRDSVGELCYIVGILLLFWLAHGDKIFYVVPLLMLALADTAAALIGEQYGRIQFHSSGGPKSVEGAVAFFFAAFFCVHVPVLLWGGSGRLESLLISVNLSVMVMLAEAAAWWGLDNLVIPLWGYMLLKSQIRMDAVGLSLDLAFVLGLGLIVWLWRDRTTLADDTLCGATLWDYVVWSVGGWRWTLPPLILLLSYATVSFRSPADQLRRFRFPVVLAQIAGSVVWLLIYRQSAGSAVFYPFVSCYAANVAIIALVRHKSGVCDLRWRPAVLVNTAKSLVVVVPSVLVMDGINLQALFDIAACLAAVFAAIVLFYELQPGLATFPVDGSRWARQAAIVALTSTLALGIYYQAPPQLRMLNARKMFSWLRS
jgi:phytol kinase